MNRNWDDLRLFLAVARAGTLTGAARALGVSQPTVSRRLKAMERRHGARLFARGADGYALTGAGQDIVAQAGAVANEIDEIERRIHGRDARVGGPIRVTCTEVMANLFFAPHFARFAAQYPEIELSVICTFDYLSLSRREADIALRVSAGPDEALIGRRLARMATAVYAAADAAPGLPPDPARWPWIGWRDEAYDRRLINRPFPGARARHRVDDLQTMRALAAAGLGVAVLPCYMADIDARLVRLLPDPLSTDRLELWSLHHPDTRNVARLRLFADFMAGAVRESRDLFEGGRPWTGAR